MNKLERRDFIMGLVALGAARGLLPPGVAEAAGPVEPAWRQVRHYRLVLVWHAEYQAKLKWEEVTDDRSEG